MSLTRNLLIFILLAIPISSKAVDMPPGIRDAGLGMTHLLFQLSEDLVIELYVSGESAKYDQFHVTLFDPVKGKELKRERYAHFLKKTHQLSRVSMQELEHLVVHTLEELEEHQVTVRQRRLPIIDSEYFQFGEWIIFGRTGIHPQNPGTLHHITIKGFRIDSKALQKQKLNIYSVEEDTQPKVY